MYQVLSLVRIGLHAATASNQDTRLGTAPNLVLLRVSSARNATRVCIFLRSSLLDSLPTSSSVGHFSRDCPQGGGGAARACHNCGQEGHNKAECTNERVMICHNCDEVGHTGRDCPKPRDCKLKFSPSKVTSWLTTFQTLVSSVQTARRVSTSSSIEPLRYSLIAI